MSASQLKRVLVQSGTYYRSGDLFYHELWRERLRQIGFVVILIEKLDAHDLWIIRLRITSWAQLHLLLSLRPPPKSQEPSDRFEHQLRTVVRRLAHTMGEALRSDYLTVERTGAYCTIAFIWKPGKPGRLRRKEKKPSAFSFLIKPWLKRNTN